MPALMSKIDKVDDTVKVDKVDKEPPERVALHQAAAALARAKEWALAMQAEVDRITAALAIARDKLFEAEEAEEQEAEASVAMLLGDGSDGDSRPRPAADITADRARAVADRLALRLGEAADIALRAQVRVAEADLVHRKTAMQVLAGEAEEIARELGLAERTAAACWRQLDVLSRLWLGGADAGRMPFGPAAIKGLQTPPRLATVDLAPPAAGELVREIAEGWRSQFAKLLAEEPGR